MLAEKLTNYNIILASASPRRQYLLRKLGLQFEVKPQHIQESYPNNFKGKDIAVYLAELKANAYPKGELKNNTLVITADTVVWHNGANLGKPANYTEAFGMLKRLSGEKHQVITGVCLKSINKLTSFYATTNVYLKELSDEVIDYYLKQYKPYDKAGAYGIQEWIGYAGIDFIEGSYYNVVGLPVEKLFDKLMEFS